MFSRFATRYAIKAVSLSVMKHLPLKIPNTKQSQLFQTFSTQLTDDQINKSAFELKKEIPVEVKYKDLIEEMVACGFIRKSFEKYTEKDFESYLKILVTKDELIELKKIYDLDEVLLKLKTKTETNLRHYLTYLIQNLSRMNEAPPDGSGQRKLNREEIFETALSRLPLLADAKYKYLKNHIKFMLENPLEIRKTAEELSGHFRDEIFEAKLENGMSAKIVLRDSIFWSSITLVDGENTWKERISREVLLDAMKTKWILKP